MFLSLSLVLFQSPFSSSVCELHLLHGFELPTSSIAWLWLLVCYVTSLPFDVSLAGQLLLEHLKYFFPLAMVSMSQAMQTLRPVKAFFYLISISLDILGLDILTMRHSGNDPKPDPPLHEKEGFGELCIQSVSPPHCIVWSYSNTLYHCLSSNRKQRELGHLSHYCRNCFHRERAYSATGNSRD